MLSFLGIGVWWLIESGALKSAAERDTGVPNPPPSLSRDDFAGGPQQLNPDSGFSGEWANVYTPGRDGAAEASGNASVEVIEEADGNVLRIVSGSADANGEVRVPLGADVMQALAIPPVGAGIDHAVRGTRSNPDLCQMRVFRAWRLRAAAF